MAVSVVSKMGENMRIEVWFLKVLTMIGKRMVEGDLIYQLIKAAVSLVMQ